MSGAPVPDGTSGPGSEPEAGASEQRAAPPAGASDDAAQRADAAARDKAASDAAAWSAVRAGGRVAFHGLMTALTIAVWVGGEVAGNVIFRGGTIRWADLADDLVVAALLGNVLAWLFWRRGERGRG